MDIEEVLAQDRSEALLTELAPAHERAQSEKGRVWLARQGVDYVSSPATGPIGVGMITTTGWTFLIAPDSATAAIIFPMWVGRPGASLCYDLMAVVPEGCPESRNWFYRHESCAEELPMAALDAALHAGGVLTPLAHPIEFLRRRGEGWVPLYRIDRARAALEADIERV